MSDNGGRKGWEGKVVPFVPELRALAEAARPLAISGPGGTRVPLAVARAATPEAPKAAAGSLASQIADAAAAQLLIFDELPEDERPRPGDRVLLVGIVWGASTLVELEQIEQGGDLPVRSLFDLPSAQLPKNFQIVRPTDGGHVITLPEAISAEVHSRGRVIPLWHVMGEGRARRIEAPFKGMALELGHDDRLVARIAPQLTLIARYVRAARQREKGLLRQLDARFTATLAAALLAFLAFAIAVGLSPRGKPDPSAATARAVEKYATRFQPRPAEPVQEPKPKAKELPGAREGERSQGEEGKLGRLESKKKEADPSRRGTPAADANKREADLKKVRRLGLVAALSKIGAGAGASSSVLGPGGIGAGLNPSLGGTKGGAGPGDSYGTLGLGTRGNGTGGGGPALGIGGLGTKGNGPGRGGPNDVDLGGRGKEDTVFVPGRTTVVGGLSRDVINRVIQKHYNEIKYCYEKELTKDPSLYGKVTVLFLIDGTGKVGEALVQQTTLSSEPMESCIVNHVRRWMFPQPQGGGTVQVTYPYVFKSSGQ